MESTAEATANAQIAELLFQQGHDYDDVEFEGDNVRVEGDMIFSRAQLLEQASAIEQKGYTNLWRQPSRSGPPTYPFRNETVCLDVRSTVSSSWASAMLHAAGKWRAEGMNILDNCDGQTGRTPRLYVDMKNDEPDNIASSTVGGPNCAGKIEINRDYEGCGDTMENLTTNMKRKVALHEMGHACSFKHPTEGQHIEGTESGTDYRTVMKQGCFEMTALSSDDKLSVSKLLGE